MIAATQLADAVRLQLSKRTGQPAKSWKLTTPVRVVERQRTTLYFFSLDGPQGRRQLVAKIKRYAHAPDDAAEDSPAARARREYDVMTQVHRQFTERNQTGLQAIHPVGYLPEMNAIVMERIDGETLYDDSMPMRRLATSAGRRRACALLHDTGRWLHVLHGVAPDGLAPRRTVRAADAREGIREEAGVLAGLGVRLEPVRIGQVLAELPTTTGDRPVWLHSDFHLRNVHVVPGDGIVGVDTALNWKGSPYVDLGKFIADMKTRRARVLRRGLFPAAGLLATFEDALLDGYFADGDPPDMPSLRLFEGWFLLRKWRRTLTGVTGARKPARRLLDAGLRDVAVNPVYAQVARRWADAVLG